jgi:sec-independent protein translocase protein TatA
MFGARSLIHWIILGVVVLLLFGGRNKISDLMGDIARGIKSFKNGMRDEEAEAAPPTAPEPMRALEHQSESADRPAEVRKAG